MAAPPGALAGKGSHPDPVAKPGSRQLRRRSPGQRSRRRRLPLGLPRLGDALRLLGGPARILRRAPRRLGKTNRLDPYPPGWPGEVERTRATRHARTLVSGAAAPVRHHLQGKHRVKQVATSGKTRSPTARTAPTGSARPGGHGNDLAPDAGARKRATTVRFVETRFARDSVPAVTDSARDHDIVVYGATGFVGVLTARYLAEHAPADARIALGGRSQAKLEQTRAQLGVEWPLVIAESQDPDAVAALARAPPASWQRPSAPTSSTASRSSRRAQPPGRTTPTSPARSCSCAGRSTQPTPRRGRAAPGSCIRAASTRSRPTSACCSCTRRRRPTATAS